MNDDIQAQEQAQAAAKALSAVRRRRFIKLGASTVPVTLTLASRPVMAWHCNTTSAWGSQQLVPTAASVKARMDAAVVTGSETWSKSHWRNNTVYGTVSSKTPFQVLAEYCGYKQTSTVVNGKTVTKTAVQNCQEQCTIGQLFGSGGLYGVSNSLKVWDAVRGLGGATEFATYMTVAKLNMQLTPGIYKTRLQACFRDNKGADQVTWMAKQGPDRYVPTGLPNTSPAWSWAKMKQYLESNWLVV